MKEELDCPFDFTSRCTMGRCDCKPKPMKSEEKNSREKRPRIKRVVCQRWAQGDDYVANLYRNLLAFDDFLTFKEKENRLLRKKVKALTAAESENERKDKEIEEMKSKVLEIARYRNTLYFKVSDAKYELQVKNHQIEELNKELERVRLFCGELKTESEGLRKENEDLRDTNKTLMERYDLRCRTHMTFQNMYNAELKRNQELLATIDRMKSDHASELDRLHSEFVVSKSIKG